MRFANAYSNPISFVALLMVVMMGTFLDTSAKHRGAPHGTHRRVHHHHHATKTPKSASIPSHQGSPMDVVGLNDSPLWVCPNDGVCSNHSSVSMAAQNIGVCQDSLGNPVSPTRYCWVPTPSHPTPTVQSPSCECSWPVGESGCVISSPAPSFYACKCSLGHEVGKCVGTAFPCDDATNYQCAIPDNSKTACELGKCNCDGYVGVNKHQGRRNNRRLHQHSHHKRHRKKSRKKKHPTNSRTSSTSAIVTKTVHLGTEHEHIWATLDPRKQTTENRQVLERLASANSTAPNGATVKAAIQQLHSSKYNELLGCSNRPAGTCRCCGSCCIFNWCECSGTSFWSTASKATCGNDGTGKCCDTRQFVQSDSSHQACSSKPQCGKR